MGFLEGCLDGGRGEEGGELKVPASVFPSIF
jgi:hypothetical protein